MLGCDEYSANEQEKQQFKNLQALKEQTESKPSFFDTFTFSDKTQETNVHSCLTRALRYEPLGSYGCAARIALISMMYHADRVQERAG